MAMQLQIPDSVVNVIRLPEKRLKDELLVELAVALYADNALSMGKAAELARCSRMAFSEILGRRDIPRHYGEKELMEDLKRARRK